jgi:2-methylcitrate dehydratase PrpD
MSTPVNSPTLSERLATFVQGVRYEDLPAEAVAKAKECILDTVGVAMAASRDDVTGPLRAYVDAVGGTAQATLFGSGHKTSVTNAALYNGTVGHLLDFDDTNQMFIGHGSAVIVPAIFALAEMTEATGRDIITAYMVGTEVQWKLGEALVHAGDHYALGWHSTGTVGAFGAAAAAAWLLKLDHHQTTTAFGLVASEAGGFQEQFGTHAKPFHAGRSNEVGIRAALLAQAGLTSARTALDGKVGYFKLICNRYDATKIANFGQPWGILETTFARGINLKAHPVCASGVGGIEGLQELIAQHGFTADDIESIRCGVRPGSLNILAHHAPTTGLQGKFSVEYWMAATLVYGKIGLAQTTDEAVQNAAVQALIPKVQVEPDESIDVSKARVNISVHLKDGRTLQNTYYPAKGAADNPMNLEELSLKFNECLAWGGVPHQQIAQARTILLNLEEASSVHDLIKQLVVPA